MVKTRAVVLRVNYTVLRLKMNIVFPNDVFITMVVLTGNAAL
jgi:hypothetical protein